MIRPVSTLALAPLLELDLTTLTDEQLVVLVREWGHCPARNELLNRYRASNHRLIRRLAARAGLQEADCQDLEQESVFWVLEAIRRYRTEEQLRVQGCRFRSFLYRVLTARFIDALRQRGGRCRRLLLQGRMVLAQKLIAPQPVAAGVSGGPGQRLEGQEMWALLQKQLTRLGPMACEMWELLAQGMPLRNIAHVLKISYDTAKRRRRQLFANLRAALGPEYRS